MTIDRRGWLKRFVAWGSSLSFVVFRSHTDLGFAQAARDGGSSKAPRLGGRQKKLSDGSNEVRQYLETVLYTQNEVKGWLEGTANPFLRTKYDPLLGWMAFASKHRDGMDGAISVYTYNPSGSRRMTMYADRPCRISTYGNSFTHCAQVSDGETWQEYLAAHLCEPVRNFGMSGFSVYQAFRRMLREEERFPAQYIILNIFSNDHYRNLRSWPSLEVPRAAPGKLVVRLPPSPYLRVNPANGEFVEYPNPCPTPESLYHLTDLDWVYDYFKDDFILKVTLARRNIKKGASKKIHPGITDLARFDSTETPDQTIDDLYTKAALFSTMRLVERVEEYALARGKKVLYVLSYGLHDLDAFRGKPRFDQQFVDFLLKKELPFVDGLEAHKLEFAQFNSRIEDYLKRYYNGHYNARGNFFQAFAMKDKLVEMLEPKPLTY